MAEFLGNLKRTKYCGQIRERRDFSEIQGDQCTCIFEVAGSTLGTHLGDQLSLLPWGFPTSVMMLSSSCPD